MKITGAISARRYAELIEVVKLARKRMTRRLARMSGLTVDEYLEMENVILRGGDMTKRRARELYQKMNKPSPSN